MTSDHIDKLPATEQHLVRNVTRTIGRHLHAVAGTTLWEI
jgi:hypothetical protein